MPEVRPAGVYVPDSHDGFYFPSNVWPFACVLAVGSLAMVRRAVCLLVYLLARQLWSAWLHELLVSTPAVITWLLRLTVGRPAVVYLSA